MFSLKIHDHNSKEGITMKTTDYTPATIADIKRLKELLNTSQHHYNQRYASHVVELPNSPLGYDLNKVLGFPDSASKNLIVRPAVVSGALQIAAA
jgi:hypothetical protein